MKKHFRAIIGLNQLLTFMFPRPHLDPSNLVALDALVNWFVFKLFKRKPLSQVDYIKYKQYLHRFELVSLPQIDTIKHFTSN